MQCHSVKSEDGKSMPVCSTLVGQAGLFFPKKVKKDLTSKNPE